MSWFDEQIREAGQRDRDMFEDSLLRMASAVLGKGAAAAGDEGAAAGAAIDAILKYYHYKPSAVPANIRDPEERMEYSLRPHGIMHRRVRLSEGWYRDSCGPLLAFLREEGTPVALLPGRISGYYYFDPADGKRRRVGRSAAERLGREAVCFYRPLPLKKLGVGDLLLYINGCGSFSDRVAVIGLTLLATLIGLLMPNLAGFLTGYVLTDGNAVLLAGTAVFMACVLISSQTVNALKSLAISRIRGKVSMAVEAAMMMRLLNLPANFFRRYSAGDLFSRLQSVKELCGLLTDSVYSAGLSSLFSLLYVVQIVHYAPALAAPAMAVILTTFALGLLAAAMRMRVSGGIMESAAKVSGLEFALINGVQKIRLSGAEKRAFSRWAFRYAGQADRTYNIPAFLKINTALMTAVSLAGTVVMYGLAVRTGVTPSDYIAFQMSFGMATGAFAALASIALAAAQIRPILTMIEPFLKEMPEASDGRAAAGALSGGIELSNVYFRYRENMPYVVNGLSLRIKAGEYVAIVGPSGCGKSTLLRLLLGFETPERGAIYYDSRDMSKLELRSLRRGIGAVLQDGSLFPGDIYSNITVAAPELTMDDAWEAAEIAGLADDIRAMPMQMHTMITEGQGGISGGQKQRVMIARAIAPKPAILMFDEATSALDNQTQRQISEALDRMKCTRIVIAHRLSTIRNCDRILMLEQGRIVEDGTYDALIARKGRFAELVEKQRLD